MISLVSIILIIAQCYGEITNVHDLNYRVEPGGRMCFFETGKAGNTMEVFYQVVDGQHGDLDISLDVIDPQGTKIIVDYKKSENSIIRELVLDGDYSFCLDNTFSSFNSKLVYIYVMIEAPNENVTEEAVVTFVDSDGNEIKRVEVMSWQGTDENGESYFVDVEDIANYLSRTLQHVVKARHMLDMYGAGKSRDSYMAYEEIFVVDLWSGFQITFMVIVGMLQVFMIKKLFKSPTYLLK